MAPGAIVGVMAAGDNAELPIAVVVHEVINLADSDDDDNESMTEAIQVPVVLSENAISW